MPEIPAPTINTSTSSLTTRRIDRCSLPRAARLRGAHRLHCQLAAILGHAKAAAAKRTVLLRLARRLRDALAVIRNRPAIRLHDIRLATGGAIAVGVRQVVRAVLGERACR